MTLSVKPLGHSRRDLRRFVNLEFRLNRHDPHWVPPLRRDRLKYLDPRRNPFFDHAEVQHLVAHRDGRDVGRIAAVQNHRHEEQHGEAVGFFGFLEVEEDAEALSALLDAASAWLANRGLVTMRGPCSYDTNEVCGALVEGFDDPPLVLMPYNRPWLPEALEAAGFRSAMDLLAFWVDARRIPDRMRRLSDRMRKRHRVRIRPFEMASFDRDVELVKDLYNAAWERNWGFVSLTEREIAAKAKDLRLAMDPDLVLFAEVDGITAGFVMALPDVNQALATARNGRLFPFGLLRILRAARSIDRMRVITLGTLPAYRHRGLEILFYRELFDRALSKGHRGGECSWVLATNEAMVRGIEACGGEVVHRYRIYDRSLT